MSADNYLYIDQKTFEVWSCTASCVTDLKKSKDIEKQKNAFLGQGKNLEEAMKIAETYESELEREGSYVEYGISRRLWCK
jgi:hypothetical protein